MQFSVLFNAKLGTSYFNIITNYTLKKKKEKTTKSVLCHFCKKQMSRNRVAIIKLPFDKIPASNNDASVLKQITQTKKEIILKQCEKIVERRAGMQKYKKCIPDKLQVINHSQDEALHDKSQEIDVTTAQKLNSVPFPIQQAESLISGIKTRHRNLEKLSDAMTDEEKDQMAAKLQKSPQLTNVLYRLNNGLKDPFLQTINEIPQSMIKIYQIKNPAPSKGISIPPFWWYDNKTWNRTYTETQYYTDVQEFVNFVIALFKEYKPDYILDNNEAFKYIMTYFVTTFDFASEEQIWTIGLSLIDFSARDIAMIINTVFYTSEIVKDDRIKTCIWHTIIGKIYFYDERNMKTDSLFGELDEKLLASKLHKKIGSNEAIFLSDLHQIAEDIHSDRMKHITKIAPKTRYNFDQEMASFKNIVSSLNRVAFIRMLSNYSLKLGHGEKIESDRWLFCTKIAIARWFFQFWSILGSIDDPSKLWNMDESGISIDSIVEEVVSKADKPTFVPDNEENINIGHISIVAAFNAAGNTVPPFFIREGLEDPPHNISSTINGKGFLACSQSGYMTKSIFLEWTKCFIAYINSKYGPPDKRGTHVLLLDSHPSRRCLQALELFKSNNIKVVTFPPHCTHAIQPYDVCIAHPFKSEIRKLFKKYIKSMIMLKNADLALFNEEILINATIDAYHTKLTLCSVD